MTLQLYVLRQLLVAIAFALAGIAFLVLPGIVVQAVHRLEGASLAAVGEYVPLVVVELVPYLAPIGFLLGVVATFGRLAADNEWTAIRMAGIHPARLLGSGLVLAVLMGLGTHHLLCSVSPSWKFEQRVHLRRVREDAFRALGQGRTELEVGGLYLSWSRREGNVMHDVVLNVPLGLLEGEELDGAAGEEEGGAVEAAPPPEPPAAGGPATPATEEALPPEEAEVVVLADAVAVVFPEDERRMEIHLRDARALVGDGSLDLQSENPYLSVDLDALVPRVAKDRSDAKYLTCGELDQALVDAEDDAERDELRYEVHRRYALSTTYVLFLLLGAPCGLRLRSGTQLAAMTVSVGFAFLYYVLSMRMGKELAALGVVGPALAAWAVNVAYLVVGLVLVRRVVR